MTAPALVVAGHPAQTPEDVLVRAGLTGTATVVLTVQDADDWLLLAALSESDLAHAALTLLVAESAAAGDTRQCAPAPGRWSGGRLRRRPTSVPPPPRSRDRPGCLPQSPPPLPTAFRRMAKRRSLPTSCPAYRRSDPVRPLPTWPGEPVISERAMFRLLRALYREMGVNSRLEALMRDRERGWMCAEHLTEAALPCRLGEWPHRRGAPSTRLASGPRGAAACTRAAGRTHP